ncbi:SDR family NAD(P)-dependent oxidoreductase [Thermoleophilia bacterium SCSIO 60948]|nr:SDR family NAD(P)-dependent oxidoreductase [Thermoleophilia bacterium SCSIO 60948]
MAESLEGTVALVTGASSGIGEAGAIALAERGATVAVAARRKERLDDVVSRIEGAGGKALAIELDVTDQQASIDAVEHVVSELGRLDTVFNNAGQMLLGPALEAPLEEWERMVEINVKGLMWVAHASLPHLVKAAEDGPRGVADMVNVSSVAGRRANANSAVYNLTKHGVGAFSEALRQELAGAHVRVSLIEPGAVATELISHNRDGVREATEKRFEGVEILEAGDIADALLYIVTAPRRVAINEVLIRPTQQSG